MLQSISSEIKQSTEKALNLKVPDNSKEELLKLQGEFETKLRIQEILLRQETPTVEEVEQKKSTRPHRFSRIGYMQSVKTSVGSEYIIHPSDQLEKIERYKKHIRSKACKDSHQ